MGQCMTGGAGKNAAIVFIKPHAVNSAVEELVRKQLTANGINILSDGKITAETIDEKKLIDKHYGAIASRAVEQTPNQLSPQDNAKTLFNDTFGQTWEQALAAGSLFNSDDAATKLGIKLSDVGERWSKLKKDTEMIKLGGGFYVGKMDNIFVINGFYVPMRAKFTTPGTCIKYFEVEWDPAKLAWKSFRADVIGATDPAKAKEGSIRNLILQDWEKMELKSAPNTGDNGVHASASPFEGLAEKANWLSVDLEKDAVYKSLVQEGLSKETILSWFGDPSVEYDGNKQSVFDMLEDLDIRDCLEKAAKINSGG